MSGEGLHLWTRRLSDQTGVGIFIAYDMMRVLEYQGCVASKLELPMGRGLDSRPERVCQALKGAELALRPHDGRVRALRSCRTNVIALERLY